MGGQGLCNGWERAGRGAASGINMIDVRAKKEYSIQAYVKSNISGRFLATIIFLFKPGVHTNDFAPIYGRGGLKLGHESLVTVFRPSRLIFQPILREILESPVVRY